MVVSSRLITLGFIRFIILSLIKINENFRNSKKKEYLWCIYLKKKIGDTNFSFEKIK
jgi:hypothetical protein